MKKVLLGAIIVASLSFVGCTSTTTKTTVEAAPRVYEKKIDVEEFVVSSPLEIVPINKQEKVNLYINEYDYTGKSLNMNPLLANIFENRNFKITKATNADVYLHLFLNEIVEKKIRSRENEVVEYTFKVSISTEQHLKGESILEEDRVVKTYGDVDKYYNTKNKRPFFNRAAFAIRTENFAIGVAGEKDKDAKPEENPVLVLNNKRILSTIGKLDYYLYKNDANIEVVFRATDYQDKTEEMMEIKEKLAELIANMFNM